MYHIIQTISNYNKVQEYDLFRKIANKLRPCQQIKLVYTTKQMISNYNKDRKYDLPKSIEKYDLLKSIASKQVAI